MALKSIESYSENQIEQLKSVSPAAHRFFSLIDKISDSNDFSKLRKLRHQYWLECALATFHNSASTEEICDYWSQCADSLIQLSFEMVELDKEPVGIFALGKLGSVELNLSSDVDLVIISQNPPHKELLDKIKLFTKLLNENTEEGFVLRVDYNLRPGGRFGPLISSVNQFADYYWSQGETWEKLAFVRLRGLCGTKEVLDQILEIGHKFSFRKFLDYTLFEDLKHLRSRIQTEYKPQKKQIDLKMGIGGIRDIELFLHALVVIHAGKVKNLHAQETSKIVEHLKTHNILEANKLNFLINTYWKLRDLENKVQLLNDQQTHKWSEELSYPVLSEQDYQGLLEDFEQVDKVVTDLLGKAELDQELLPQSESEQKKWLAELGFNNTSIEKVWPQLMQYTALSKRQQKDESIRRNFLYLFIKELVNKNQDMDLGLHLLFDFVRSTRAKASFFSLLVREKPLISNLARLFSTSPYLGGLIASRPELLDAYLFRVQEAYSTDTAQMLDEMAERRLITELIASSEFLGQLNVVELTKSLSNCADNICSYLLEHLKKQHAPESTIDILTLGKWGGKELGLRSDLDFVFVVDHSPDEDDYKVAKRFISRLNDQHRGGKIYSVDLRLRPSGNAGPMILNKNQLDNFLKNEAPIWLKQSYLRARFLSEKPCEEIYQSCVEQPLTLEDKKELLKIRNKLRVSLTKNKIDIKHSQGGLIDIEFYIQISFLKLQVSPKSSNTLLQMQQLKEIDPNWTKVYQQLSKNYLKMRQWEQLYQLVSLKSGSVLELNSESFKRMVRLLKTDPKSLEQEVLNCLKMTYESLAKVDPLGDSA
ncbi:MAG: glutamine-synthetase adenylyltransferase [Bdellovibrionales bacterium]|nr:glutamine-synthetase adenylyltransferase [Bdellovibrionales bacterium]